LKLDTHIGKFKRITEIKVYCELKGFDGVTPPIGKFLKCVNFGAVMHRVFWEYIYNGSIISFFNPKPAEVEYCTFTHNIMNTEMPEANEFLATGFSSCREPNI
jgi:hypothetical protein